MKSFALALAVLFLSTVTLRAQDTTVPAVPVPATPVAQPFDFALPWDDKLPTIVDVSSLNPAPIDETRRLRVQDGDFRDATNRRVRFLGTNFAGGACFPPKADAPQIAARLRKYGFNCVRLHHMDAPWAQPNLFYFSGGSENKSTAGELSVESLDRLDWLVFQLKQHGIYVDLNLHVTRAWSAADGFPDADKTDPQGKILSYFDQRAIALQQDFARKILNHTNAYTKQTYAQDPVVAIVEMTNEDTLLGKANEVRELPHPYVQELQTRWNAWLRGRYKTTAKVVESWNRDAMPLGAELLKNSRFAAGSEGWSLENQAETKAELSVEDPTGATNAPAGRVLRVHPIQTDKTDWHLQLHFTGLNLQEGQLYTLNFAARAEAARNVTVGARRDVDPWSFVGLDAPAALDTNWKRFSYSFRAKEVAANHTRISFMFGNSAVDFQLGDVSLRSGGGGIELLPTQTIDDASIPLPTLGATASGRDYANFLRGVEGDYTRIMRETIRATGSRAPLLGSQASYGGLGGVWRESQLDVVDMHAYWQHPNFPNKAWDANDYRIANTAMIADDKAGTLSGLAMHRVLDKPFMVTEYDHPAPNEYAAEMVPMIFAYAAWQDWDGIFLFAYNGQTEFRRDHIDGYFDIAAHPAKMAFLPAAAQMWLRGYIGRAPQRQVLTIPTRRIDELVAAGSDYDFWTQALKNQTPKIDARDFLKYRSALRFDAEASEATLQREERNVNDAAPSQLEWLHLGAQSRFLINSPGAKGVLGFLGGLPTEVGGLRLQVAPSTRNFASIVLTAMDGKPTHISTSLLLTAIDKAENPALQWNAERNFAANAWQNGPVQVYGVQAQISLPTLASAAHVYALDATGTVKGEIAAQLENGRLNFVISPTDQAVWYRIDTEIAVPKKP